MLVKLFVSVRFFFLKSSTKESIFSDGSILNFLTSFRRNELFSSNFWCEWIRISFFVKLKSNFGLLWHFGQLEHKVIPSI